MSEAVKTNHPKHEQSWTNVTAAATRTTNDVAQTQNSEAAHLQKTTPAKQNN